MTLAPDDPRHGSVNAYRNFYCRCAECRAAIATYMRHYRTHRASVPAVHGAVGYSNGCRCDACRQGRREDQARRRLDKRTASA